MLWEKFDKKFVQIPVCSYILYFPNMFQKQLWTNQKKRGVTMSKNIRFQRILSQGNLHINEIWVDTETGVQYFYHCSTYGGGLTPLLGPDGKPLLADLPIQKPGKDS